MLMSPDPDSVAASDRVVRPSLPRPQEQEVDSLQLLQGQRELRIRHGNECYRLRRTRSDKLILTK